ncbi:hypothetical protein BGZ80_010627 [Entomortierella chlamydospora]|uniref:Uncharacterized protein n=1 Tax=Entomortierella chlamydospora TaxID=101097 RepID=A0A9P6N2Q1_9FUNG|nr:hypothetical protein BGZ79_005959 [Entomortierella chlamydospora]KAG0023007.1 hypothetical protein BGZ80_010627 [Entomortierella chlamydospora]
MTVTRSRRLASSTVSTSRPTPRQSGSTQRAAARGTDSITDVKINNNNNGSSNDGDDDEEKEEEDDNNIHGKRNLGTSSRIPEQADNLVLKSHPPSESKKITSLTARGTRGTRRRINKRGLAPRGKANTKPGFFSDGDDDDDVEEPRLHYLESVVVPDYHRTTKGIDIFKEVAGRARKAQKDYKAIFSVNEETPSSTTKTIEPDTALLGDSSIQLPESQQTEQIEHDDNDDPNSLLFSRLSLTPPPMMFELEEGFESMETPWQMVFDSAQSSSSLDPQPRIKIAELTLADLGNPQEDGRLDDIIDDFEEHDDDPFGFTKVERQLEKTKKLRPKLLAINEVNNRAFVTAAAGTTIDTKGSTSGNRRDSNLGNRLDRIVLERSAARKRGDVKNKGKAVDRGVPTSSDINNASGAGSDDAGGVADLDLQKAIQLSRGLDIASGEGCSSTAIPASSSGTAGNEAQSTVLTEQPSITQNDVATPSIAAIRSSRRISRMYGKSTSVHDSQDTQIASKDPSFSTENNSTTSDNNNDLSDFAFTFTNLPSTPQKPSSNNNNKNTSRTSQQDFRLSISSDDLSPIVIETTPPKKPEAGMPSSLESPSTSKTNRNARPKKYMLTEQLEALLPRRRRPKERLGLTRKGASSARLVLSSGADIESENDSDDASASSELSSSEEEDDDKEEEEAQHRGRVRKRPAKSTTSNQISSKKRRTPAESKIPQAKHTLPSSKSNVSTAATTNSSSLKSKGKEREKEKEEDEDKSGWTAAQLEAHRERIKYFQQVDDFELEVETL